MKNLIIDFVLAYLAFGSGVGLFFLKYRVVKYEKELAAIHRTIIADRREIHALKADWAVLTEPSRLRKLIQDKTDFKTIQGKQFIQPEEIEFTPVPMPPRKPNFDDTQTAGEDHVVS